MEETTPQTSGALKGGVKTSEFWLALGAQIIGSALAVGLIPTDSHWERVAGMALMVLGSMGYTWSRQAIKLEALRSFASLALPSADKKSVE